MTGTAGLFISIEGGEGSGKTTQCRTLVDYLEARGERALYVREPGGTLLGERLREIVLFTRDLSLTPEAEALLFSSARAQLTREVIAPALDLGTHVVADRFFDSTIAYQGYGAGADPEGLRFVTHFATGGLIPDLTFLLDLPVNVAMKRVHDRANGWDRIESHDAAFHERVRDGYLALARGDRKRWIVLDGSRTQPDIAGSIAARIDQELERRSHRIPTGR